jgi:hypothetical protein
MGINFRQNYNQYSVVVIVFKTKGSNIIIDYTDTVVGTWLD